MEKLIYRELKGAAEGEGILMGDNPKDQALLRAFKDVDKKIHGYISRVPGKPTVILVKPDLPYIEKIRTLSHEMGHYFFHINNGCLAADAPKELRKQKEEEANNFADWFVGFIENLIQNFKEG